MEALHIAARARPLGEHLRPVLHRAIEKHGVRAVAEALDCSRQTLLGGLAGVDIRLEVVERMEARAEALAAGQGAPGSVAPK